MVKLEKLNREEVNSKPFLINQIFDLYGGVPGEFYSYKYQGEDRWLYRDGLYATILGIEGEYIVYTSFMINEDYELSYMEFDDFYAALNDSGEMLLWKEGSKIAESVRLQKRAESACFNDLDGLITHHQVNTQTGEDMLVSYKSVYRSNPQYFQSAFSRPFMVCFIRNGKVEKYLQYTTSTDYLSYDIITIKEFGLMEFLQNGSYALQQDRSITRYFKVKAQKEDGTCVILYPLSRAYTPEEMDKMIEERGFTRKVDDDVIDYYNGNYLEVAEYQELAVAMNEYDKSISGDKKLGKVPGGINANN